MSKIGSAFVGKKKLPNIVTVNVQCIGKIHYLDHTTVVRYAFLFPQSKKLPFLSVMSPLL